MYPIYLMWLFMISGMNTTLPSVPGEHPKIDVGGMIQCLKEGDATVIPLVPYFLDLMREEVEKRYVEPVALFLGLVRKPNLAYACPTRVPYRVSLGMPRWNFIGFLQFRSIAMARERKSTPDSLREIARAFSTFVANLAKLPVATTLLRYAPSSIVAADRSWPTGSGDTSSPRLSTSSPGRFGDKFGAPASAVNAPI
jgi:hypothetical protein